MIILILLSIISIIIYLKIVLKILIYKMSRVAFITGITGQDGSYLTELLLEKKYHVWGLIRRASNINTYRIDNLFHLITLRYGDVTEGQTIITILNEIYSTYPDLERLEVYNLAAMSHVKISFDLPEYTANGFL